MQNPSLTQDSSHNSGHVWQQLVEQEAPMLFRVAYRYVQNKDEAQDIVQEALLRGYTRIEELQDPTKIGAWLRQIVVNLCRMWFRKQPKTEWVPLDTCQQTGLIASEYTLLNPTFDRLTVSSSDYHSIEVREMTEQLLASLSEKLHQTVQLYYLQGLSYQEIAAAMDVPIGTVKRRLHDARQQLKERVYIMSSEQSSKQKVLKHAVGLETTGESHSPLFNKGTLLPVACTVNFSTASDNQGSIELHLLQGDSTRMAECKSLGKVTVNGITPGQPRQDPQLMVTFTIDAGETLTCKAKELPNKELHILAKPAQIATREVVV